MKLCTETTLDSFEFWSGARPHAEQLTNREMDTIESIFEELYPEGMTETAINDFFWFEPDTIAEWLGYEDWEDLESDRADEDDEDEGRTYYWACPICSNQWEGQYIELNGNDDDGYSCPECGRHTISPADDACYRMHH